MTYKGWVDDAGHFALDVPCDQFRREVAKFKGHEVLVTVRKWVPDVSRARRYYRGVVVPDIRRACGYADPEDNQKIHDSLAWKFLALPPNELGYPRRQSTSNEGMAAGPKSMSTYIDEVILWAETTIVGCRIRRVDEVDEDDYETWEDTDD
jgi:hypothetical protein